MEKLASLDFSNPNNASLSTRVIAEWLRQGEVQVLEISTIEVEKRLGLMVNGRVFAFSERRPR